MSNKLETEMDNATALKSKVESFSDILDQLNSTEEKKKVYDGLQLAYKVTANSIYGQMGAKTSSIFFKKIAFQFLLFSFRILWII